MNIFTDKRTEYLSIDWFNKIIDHGRSKDMELTMKALERFIEIEEESIRTKGFPQYFYQTCMEYYSVEEKHDRLITPERIQSFRVN